ncbi:hypothetical protein N7462_003374 [Penicillium macrosclerotiorum]|uniref:uncharacterized protein n=1 Tax=Penicillium macrosclerotiorum TaxID=303699 RepID=UPI002546BF06|nr:uncharacterized protein N7462_003374 [Penicillium macrosclerotiorum]KAJ5688982.1 hypothetical protein N7462_003374 [Penicillium macrosclerotiorum]
MHHWLSALALGALAVPRPTLAGTIGTKRSEFSLCAINNRQIVQNASSDIWPWQTYQSTNVTPPYMSINRTGADLASGLLFIGQENDSGSGVKQVSPFILTDDNELVWSGPEGDSSNFRQQYWGDQSVITFWVGTGKAAYGADAGRGWGEVRIYNDEYRLIKSVCLQLNLTMPTGTTTDCDADVHESFITEDNTILLTAYNTTQADLTSLGGPKDGWVYDSIVVELDLETNEPVFIWSPLAHVAINETHEAYTGSDQTDPFDWFHMNSIQKWGDYYLVNSRHLWRTFLVDREGSVVWSIDGENGGDFGSLPANGTFSWQHMARIHSVSSTQAQLSYFANNLDTATSTVPSKGLTFLLTLPPSLKNPPVLVTDFYDHLYPVSSAAEGSFFSLPNGNTLMGYGDEPYIKEYGPSGDVRWSAQFAGYDLGQSYRVYKQEWHATPSTRPSLVVTTALAEDNLSQCAGSSSRLRGYVSWNGATDVDKYQVYAGKSSNSLKSLGQIDKKGFETKFSLPEDVSVVQVAAIQAGKVVRKSNIAHV